ncbi:PilW family protein [Acinetobacter guillouiae]|uniref:PilW family protein n=1 Tax=Acinetobacter guillouiae TaxID=106649 RepID=UPI0026E20E48|nr:PilW family protein [Acinetobacter guillouiae]MDO6645595.1 PilW family protein [Acinetobacter guillouiae]
MKNQLQKGFTLVELIVALALGLIISAAALQLFTGGLITTRLQQAGAELQDSGVFGLEYMAHDIRLANYGNTNNPELNDKTNQGGVVLTSGATGNVNLPIALDTKFLTTAGGVSNVNAASDQLTILFIAPNKMFNCEGAEVAAGEYILQRYFLRKDDNGQNDTDYALACDANTPPATSIAQIKGMGERSQIIMPRVDHLRFYLGTQNNNKTNLSYYSIDKYMSEAKTAAAANKKPPRVVSIKVGVLVRSKDDTKSTLIDPTASINFLNEVVKLKNTSSKYLRREYTTTIALRNAMGEPL